MKVIYHFANLVSVKDSSGLEPGVPNYISGYNSYSPKDPTCTWSLCFSTIDPNYEGAFDELELVSKELELLIDSGSKFPPALAIALNRANSLVSATKHEYEKTLIEYLLNALRSQARSKYILCEVVKEGVGYRSKGGFVWIIGFNPKTENVNWVSDDFHIYSDDISCFDIEQHDLIFLS